MKSLLRLAVLVIRIHVSATAVLFLFVVMMLDIKTQIVKDYVVHSFRTVSNYFIIFH